jgi:hypothetical protein
MKVVFTFLFLFSMQLFAGIGVGYSTVGVLPVELSSFTSNINGRDVNFSLIHNFVPRKDEENSYCLNVNLIIITK